MSAADIHQQGHLLSSSRGTMGAATMVEPLGHSGAQGVAQEIGLLLRGRAQFESLLTRDVPRRSGSAPPSVEGSLAGLAAMGGFFSNNEQTSPPEASDVKGLSSFGSNISESEQELRSDPAYLAYYYSHINLNPRLPPPLISWENWRLAQRLQAGVSFNGVGEKAKMRSLDDTHSKSLFSTQPVLPTHREEGEEGVVSGDESSGGASQGLGGGRDSSWMRDGDGLMGMSSIGLGPRPKSLVDLIQEDFPRTPSPVYALSRNATRTPAEELDQANAALAHLHEATAALSMAERAAALNSARSATASPNPMMGNRASSPAPVGHSVLGSEGVSMSDLHVHAELAAKMMHAKMSEAAEAERRRKEQEEEMEALQKEQREHIELQMREQQLRKEQQKQQQQKQQQQQQQQRLLQAAAAAAASAQQQQPQYSEGSSRGGGRHVSQQNAPNFNQQQSNMYAAAAAAAMYQQMAAGNPYYQNMAAMYGPQYAAMGMAGYPIPPAMMNPMMGGYPPAGMPLGVNEAIAAGLRGGPSHPLYKFAQGAGGQMPPPPPMGADPLYLAYMQRTAEEARAAAADPRAGFGNPEMLAGLDPKNSMAGMIGEQGPAGFGRTGANIPAPNKSGMSSPGYYGSPPGPVAMPFPQPAQQPLGSSGGGRRERGHGGGPGFAEKRGGHAGDRFGWPGNARGEEEARGSSLLEEFKNSKTRRFELADIVGHVVEFSADQHGSRFIQQKLETATPEEKALVFEEVLPRALTLMTDVFGNYVIQKFFEHGTTAQRRELAKQLQGHVLTLSLQMYGCRVIQKALEVVEPEQQSQLVAELDGHVMRCVRDQNGNHVIQKCIECVAPERIQFIINSFYGSVVSLSTHPYGCRVIQRVLEHCTDDQKSQGIMDEILRSTCTLAQDQYGNYVVQHVLEHGKEPERSEIITKLAGNIVQMSQHKFASNVVEKCLQHGGPAERQILINEMLGLTDENEPLQAMMKDQFANYVVQKVLETCDDVQREMLLTRIKVHLGALKKYTYGKHIVARVEKLVAGASRIPMKGTGNTLAAMQAAQLAMLAPVAQQHLQQQQAAQAAAAAQQNQQQENHSQQQRLSSPQAQQLMHPHPILHGAKRNAA